MRDARIAFGIFVGAVAIVTCAEPTKPPAGRFVQPFQPATLNAAKVEKVREYADGGCVTSGADSGGVTRAFATKRQNLPFALPAIAQDPKTGFGNGTRARITFKSPSGSQVAMSCLVPNTVGPEDFAKAIKKANPDRWRTLVGNVKHGQPVPAGLQAAHLSNEAREVRAELTAPKGTGALANEICYDVKGTISWYSDSEGWSVVDIEFEICVEGGEETNADDLYWWCVDNSYTEYPYVIVEASRKNITALDTVTFDARVVSDFHLNVDGWTWSPGAGADPWTSVCAGPDTECTIGIHGSGTMTYTVEFNGEAVPGSVWISAVIPADVEYDEHGDADVPGYSPSPEPSPQRLSGPFVPEPVRWFSGEIDAAQSMSILVDGIYEGEWRYTQGCAQGCTGPFSEPDVDLPAHTGDCTDFVWWTVRAALGSSSWPFTKTSTKMFNSFSQAGLASFGYEPVDSAGLRTGDIVVRTKTDGCLCGHAGIFIGWAAGGYPIGWANNGVPATPTRANGDSTTKAFHFRVKAGTQVKFFRPILP
jgi:hypothetical protein